MFNLIVRIILHNKYWSAVYSISALLLNMTEISGNIPKGVVCSGESFRNEEDVSEFHKAVLIWSASVYRLVYDKYPVEQPFVLLDDFFPKLDIDIADNIITKEIVNQLNNLKDPNDKEYIKLKYIEWCLHADKLLKNIFKSPYQKYIAVTIAVSIFRIFTELSNGYFSMQVALIALADNETKSKILNNQLYVHNPAKGYHIVPKACIFLKEFIQIIKRFK